MFGIMPTEPRITNERVDDIPVVLTQIEQMGVEKNCQILIWMFGMKIL